MREFPDGLHGEENGKAAGDRLHEESRNVLSVKDIRQYIEMALQGDDTIDLCLSLFEHQRGVMKRQMEELQHAMEMVDYKCWYYETAKAAGAVNAP